jgi:hypothetical protein
MSDKRSSPEVLMPAACATKFRTAKRGQASTVTVYPMDVSGQPGLHTMQGIQNPAFQYAGSPLPEAALAPALLTAVDRTALD